MRWNHCWTKTHDRPVGLSWRFQGHQPLHRWINPNGSFCLGHWGGGGYHFGASLDLSVHNFWWLNPIETTINPIENCFHDLPGSMRASRKTCTPARRCLVSARTMAGTGLKSDGTIGQYELLWVSTFYTMLTHIIPWFYPNFYTA